METIKELTPDEIRKITDEFHTLGVVGEKGSGKSVLGAMFGAAAPVRTFVFDMLGVYNPDNKFKTAVIPGMAYYPSPESFIQNYDKTAKKHVISFENVELDNLVQAVDMVCEFIIDKVKKDGIETEIIADEAADFVPEAGKISNKFHILTKNGRNWGIRPVIFLTQRPQSVTKKIFELADGNFLFGQLGENTLDRTVSMTNTRDPDEMRTLLRELPPRHVLFVHKNEIQPYKIPTYKNAFKQR
ncbi:hypothetical protein [Methanolapillus africanus]|uniref:hypothetical protein n=1 Tax=Methanolapillus africanus TaxID=3028297 RepID=UPI0030B8FA35